MNKNLILALDQGTTSSRAISFNYQGEIASISQKEFKQIFPQLGWVEHDANEIWESQLSVANTVINKAKSTNQEIEAIGITNQRETTLVWDKATGKPIYNAIVWQDRRTADYCQKLKAQGHLESIKKKTGLIIDSYFSATKLKWILDNVEGARLRAKNNELCFGTIDTWLIWKLTDGQQFVTDVSNASRTMLLNIHNLEWDKELLKLFDIPEQILPEVRSNSEVYGYTSSKLFDKSIPISGIAGDQQAALFGQLCLEKGMVKNTYGTGCFLLMNTGNTPVFSKNNLLTTIAWKINGEITYALEGSIFVGGAAVQWIRDGLKIIESASDIEPLAASVPDNGGVYFVPALTGLGAPHWDAYARGTIIGLTRGSTQAHIARATLESIAYQVYDVVKAMEADSGAKGKELRVDGGATSNDLLLQFQTDIFEFPVVRPKIQETTALGAAYLAGLAVGFWKDIESLKDQWSINKTFTPKMEASKVEGFLNFWHKAVSRSKNWIED